MIRSMTAFAVQEKTTDWGQCTWEVRSVNHRYLEVSLRLPEEFRVLEPRVRECIASRLQRGKVDAVLKVRGSTQLGAGLRLNAALAAGLAQLMQEARQHAPQLAPGDCLEFLRWPGMVSMDEGDLTAQHEAALELLAQTLDELVRAREREGQLLRELLLERLAGIEALCAQVHLWLPMIRQALRERLEARLSELKLPLDTGRLEQELVLHLQKMDVSEELDRLAVHVTEARRQLHSGQAVGRRLDFLLQEFNRESNTLGSKSVDQRTAHASVELKVLIEQMREQVQNLE